MADERGRVDYIFYKGSDVEIKDVSIVGTKKTYVYNKMETLNTDKDRFMTSELSWPSDHKGVFARLLFTFEK